MPAAFEASDGAIHVDDTVASIRNDAGARGLAFTRAASTTTLQASLGTVSA